MSDCLLGTPRMTHSSRFSGFKMETPVGGGVQDGGGTHVYQWPIHVDVWQKPSLHCKVIILQLKWIN